MIGSHLIRSYSKTQSVVAKSSGESELYAVIRASTEGLGIITLLKDLGIKDAKVRIGMDASAAIGMAQRTGLNKVRHVEVDVLWIQEQLARRLLPIAKIPGPQKPSPLHQEHRCRALGAIPWPDEPPLRGGQSGRSSEAPFVSAAWADGRLPRSGRPGNGAPWGNRRSDPRTGDRSPGRWRLSDEAPRGNRRPEISTPAASSKSSFPSRRTKEEE